MLDTPSNEPQRRRITIAEAEDEHTPQDQSPERLREFPELTLPFGFQNNLWEALKSQMKPGDELWEHSSDAESWEQLMGSAGIQLVRDGVVIDGITTLFN